MLLLVQIWLAVAIFMWGIATVLVAWGAYGISGSKLLWNRNTGDPNVLLLLLGAGVAAVGIFLFLAALISHPANATFYWLMAGALLLIGLQLVTGHARFEYEVGLTLCKNSRGDIGIISRGAGAVTLFVVAFITLASFDVIQPPPAWLAGIVGVCSTLLASALINVLTGSIAPQWRFRRAIVTLLGVAAFGMLLSQTALWPTRAATSANPADAPDVTVSPEPTSARPTPTEHIKVAAPPNCLNGWEERLDRLVQMLDKHLTQSELVALSLRFLDKMPDELDSRGRSYQIGTLVTELDRRVPNAIPELLQWVADNRPDLCDVEQ